MSTVKKSSAQESYVADVLGAKRTPRSGATIHAKADVADPLCAIECKTYMAVRDSFTVKREWLTKLSQERFEERKQFSILVQNFGGKANEDNYVIMKLEDFAKMYEIYKEAIDG